MFDIKLHYFKLWPIKPSNLSTIYIKCYLSHNPEVQRRFYDHKSKYAHILISCDFFKSPIHTPEQIFYDVLYQTTSTVPAYELLQHYCIPIVYYRSETKTHSLLAVPTNWRTPSQPFYDLLRATLILLGE